ncbi:hypothetical protein LCGC14_2686850, partial [marine sediment metagenome]
MTQKEFKLSTRSNLFVPLHDSKWLATNRDNILDDNANTSAIIKVWGGTEAPEEIDWIPATNYWQSVGRAAWEIIDPEMVLGGLFRPDSFTEIYARGRNLHMYLTELPPLVSGLTPLVVSFNIVNSANNENTNEVVYRPIGRINDFDNLNEKTIGPLQAADA